MSMPLTYAAIYLPKLVQNDYTQVYVDMYAFNL